MRRLLYGSIQSSGLRINYYRTGEEKPPVVLLHGLGDSGLSWNRLPVALEPEFDVIMVDLRGHGFSQSPAEGGFDPEDHAGDVLNLIDTLRLDHPALIGHSLGAHVAAIVAAQNPRWVRGLVLIEPPWPQAGADAGERAAVSAQWHEHLRQLKELSLDELVAMGTAFPNWHESEAFQWAKARKMVNPRAAEGLASAWADWQELLRRIEAPGLLFGGEAALGSSLGAGVLQTAGQIWRRGEAVSVEGSGHNPHREAYRPVLRLIQRGLRRWMYA